MNAVKRQKPTISPDDIERLLFHLEDARNYVVKYSAAQDFTSPEKVTAGLAIQAIDDLAKQITGNREYFWQVSARAGDNDMAFHRALEKAAKRRLLMGVHIPMRAFRIPTTP